MCTSPVGKDDSKSQMIDCSRSLPEEQVQVRGGLRRHGPKFNWLQNEGKQKRHKKSKEANSAEGGNFKLRHKTNTQADFSCIQGYQQILIQITL